MEFRIDDVYFEFSFERILVKIIDQLKNKVIKMSNT